MDEYNVTPLAEKQLYNDVIWKDFNPRNDDNDDSDDDSVFSDTDGNYCINDECCAPQSYFVINKGTSMCNKCGFLQKQILEEQEWNNYTDSTGGYSKDNSRCPYPSNSNNPFESEHKTFIPKGYMINFTVKACLNESCRRFFHDMDSTSCSRCGGTEYVKKNIKRDLSMIHIRQCYNHREKSYNNVKHEILAYCTDKYSGCVINTATELWGEIMKANKLTRGGVRKGLIACCIYYSCIHNKCPLTIDQVCKDFDMEDSVNFNKGNKEFQQVFEISKKWAHVLTNTVTSDSLFAPFCEKLGMEFKFIKKCEHFYEKLKIGTKLRVAPKSAASGVIYFMCKHMGKDVSVEEISKKLNVCVPTLTKTIDLISELVEKKRLKNKK